MRVNDAGARSVAASARRAQIIAATIETIGELGYGQASFARIAERAGLSSTRLISYHFAGKDELIQAVIAELYGEMAAFMGARMRDVTDPPGALAAYIRAVVAFVATHRTQMDALMSVFLSAGAAEAPADGGYAGDTAAFAPLLEILDSGQRSGHFRAFDSFVMAATVQRSLDGLPFLLRTAPELDLDAYAEELVTLFTLATTAGG
ncbi:TetR/AcrR family transcriptional regulator [Streptacidiphilus jiangxiensis]|uniref:Regulatory protein, tetR family n=1 Tax=Streptacidiphilus jiangxiensis TaxID=235985 RepID=A0A1H7J0J6_STRJI|nr:TetR/AcrR family transcriptional regulator [Streptacidiphilus jiangxiensis]SEK67470.1 regulatory protein, tetR family [Streptacidiphilus jiangxiensis]